ncbi:hypothetical protein K439DRAFT_393143 [Ramaria rubella]|nr:hypothetical protein K439DRAFT_393143 [Ramaria rubella]
MQEIARMNSLGFQTLSLGRSEPLFYNYSTSVSLIFTLGSGAIQRPGASEIHFTDEVLRSQALSKPSISRDSLTFARIHLRHERDGLDRANQPQRTRISGRPIWWCGLAGKPIEITGGVRRALKFAEGKNPFRYWSLTLCPRFKLKFKGVMR